MWTVVYIFSNRILAEQLKAILTEEGLLATVRPVGIPHLGDSGPFELLVPESEAEEAQEIINSKIPG
ncbi:MAG: putative signal transducing protein [Desulfocucumaceae bacterium]